MWRNSEGIWLVEWWSICVASDQSSNKGRQWTQHELKAQASPRREEIWILESCGSECTDIENNCLELWKRKRQRLIDARENSPKQSDHLTIVPFICWIRFVFFSRHFIFTYSIILSKMDLFWNLNLRFLDFSLQNSWSSF